MKNPLPTPPPKPIALQVRILLSMMYQVKDRLEIKRWMKTQDIYEAHLRLFEKMGERVEHDYGLDVTPTYHFKAIDLFVSGMSMESFSA